MALNIPLNDLGGDENAKASEHVHPLDEVLFSALEAKNGVELEFADKKDAAAMRFRFYRRVTFHRKKGLKSFDLLVFNLEGRSLIITRLPSFNLKART